MACILVLWPTWMICRLYEQKAMATAPMTAMYHFTPKAISSRKPPSIAMKSHVAGRLPTSRKSYSGCVQSPLSILAKEVVGIPPNIESVQ